MFRKFAGFASAAGLVVCVACGQTDAGITTAVKTKLAADDTVKAYQVDVDTKNHVVTLSGAVENPAAKAQAVQIARNTKGVNDVIDQITVNETAATSGINGDYDVNMPSGSEMKSDVKAGAQDTKNAAERAGSATKNAAEKAGDATVDTAKKVGSATVSGAKKAGNAIKGAVTDKDRDSDNDGH